jgi:hypothetical protein
VTLFDDSDNSLLGTLAMASTTTCSIHRTIKGGSLDINTNPRNGRPEFNTSAFSPEVLGRLGNAPRRFFYGPSNFDLTLTKLLRITESKSLEFRLEGFNVFNHAQFYGAASWTAR